MAKRTRESNALSFDAAKKLRVGTPVSFRLAHNPQSGSLHALISRRTLDEGTSANHVSLNVELRQINDPKKGLIPSHVQYNLDGETYATYISELRVLPPERVKDIVFSYKVKK